MTDALKIAEQRLRSQGPSQARVADALSILNTWYQEAHDAYRNRYAGADGLAGTIGQPGAQRGVDAACPGEGDGPSVQVRRARP